MTQQELADLLLVDRSVIIRAEYNEVLLPNRRHRQSPHYGKPSPAELLEELIKLSPDERGKRVAALPGRSSGRRGPY